MHGLIHAAHRYQSLHQVRRRGCPTAEPHVACRHSCLMHVPHAGAAKAQGPEQKPRNWIINALERNVESHPDWPVYRYLNADGNVTETITCKGALQAAHSVAAYLTQECKLKPGDRVALVYPPGAARGDASMHAVILLHVQSYTGCPMPCPTYQSPKCPQQDAVRRGSDKHLLLLADIAREAWLCTCNGACRPAYGLCLLAVPAAAHGTGFRQGTSPSCAMC